MLSRGIRLASYLSVILRHRRTKRVFGAGKLWEAHQRFCSPTPVPEGREKLAGGKALRRHPRNTREKRCAPEGAREPAWITRQRKACIEQDDSCAASGAQMLGGSQPGVAAQRLNPRLISRVPPGRGGALRLHSLHPADTSRRRSPAKPPHQSPIGTLRIFSSQRVSRCRMMFVPNL